MSRNNGRSNAPSTNADADRDQLNRRMADITLDSTEDTVWEVVARKSKNRSGSTSVKPWGPSHTPAPAYGRSERLPDKRWGSNSGAGQMIGNAKNQAMDFRKEAGPGNPKLQQSNMSTSHVTSAPLTGGWQWGSRGGSSGSQTRSQETTYDLDSDNHQRNDALDDEDEELLDDDTDGDLSDYDSDESQKSHDTRKQNKWLKPLFDSIDALTVEELNEQTRKWHCPACHDGPGAIAWYLGMQPLITHAKTKGKIRVRLHRELAELLEEELRRRGTSSIPSGEVFGKWKGLDETTADYEIVWPPMVVVMNTQLEKDENDKWLGMGNQELVDYFNTYAVSKSRASYGPQGHRGMSVLIFESNPVGYVEAERLDKQFADEGRGRDAWERGRPLLFGPGGKRQLYGYLASRRDMESFNRHCRGKACLKFEIKSYRETVSIPLRQMAETNQQYNRVVLKAGKQERYVKNLEQTLETFQQKLLDVNEENKIVRLRTKMQHEEHKEEMDHQERFYKEQLERIYMATEEKEEQFEKLLQEDLARWSVTNSGTNENLGERQQEIEKLIRGQEKGIEGFEAEREKLIKMHKDKKAELSRKHHQEDIELEMELHNALAKLMEHFSPAAQEK